ncbi:MAG: DOMON domain-containing protein [Desulfobulbaceae bacterium]|nr:DOMON domain-containing protein [Desulfobulbaceae bacterium]
MKMTYFQGMIIGISLMLCAAVAIAGSTEYQHEVKDKNISFAWTIDGDNLAVKLVAKTNGWVGIGFNPVEKMAGANFILGYVKKGKAKVVDEFGVEENKHTSDKKLGGSADAVLVGGTEVDGVTTIEFTMPLESEDKNDTQIDVNGDTTVLLSYGAGRDSFKTKHKYRSALIVNLSTGVFEKKGK